MILPVSHRLTWGTLLVASLFALVWTGSARAQSTEANSEPAQVTQAVAPEGSAPPADAAVELQSADRAETPDPEDANPAALRDFRPYLDQHGVWVDDPTYGLVWVPNESAVGAGFTPYVTNGHWALTEDDQWIWVSHYPFGWVVFHYGRWAWTPAHHWVWVPGYRYSHAWVSFRVSSGGAAYVGWAPLPPRYVWHTGVAVWFGTPPPAPYYFVPSYYVFSYHVHHHVIHDHHRLHYLARHTHHHRPRYYVGRDRRVRYVGPSLSEARVPHRAVPQRRVAPDPRSQSFRRTLSHRTVSSSTVPRASRESAAPRAVSRRLPQQSVRTTPIVRPVSGVRSAPRRAERVRRVSPPTVRGVPRSPRPAASGTEQRRRISGGQVRVVPERATSRSRGDRRSRQVDTRTRQYSPSWAPRAAPKASSAKKYKRKHRQRRVPRTTRSRSASPRSIAPYQRQRLQPTAPRRR